MYPTIPSPLPYRTSPPLCPTLPYFITLSPPIYNPLPWPTPLHSTIPYLPLYPILPYPTLPLTLLYSTLLHSILPSPPLPYSTPQYLPTLSPLRITLPYHAPSPPLFHSTNVTPFHFTLPSLPFTYMWSLPIWCKPPNMVPPFTPSRRGSWGYTHDRRADKYPYPHDRHANKDSYRHDRNVTGNLCSLIKLCFAFIMVNFST